jgi:hypothetical protein
LLRVRLVQSSQLLPQLRKDSCWPCSKNSFLYFYILELALDLLVAYSNLGIETLKTIAYLPYLAKLLLRSTVAFGLSAGINIRIPRFYLNLTYLHPPLKERGRVNDGGIRSTHD